MSSGAKINVYDKTRIKAIKTIIEKSSINIDRIRVEPVGSCFQLAFCTNVNLEELNSILENEIKLEHMSSIEVSAVKSLTNKGILAIISKLPKRFSIYNPLLLLPPSTDVSLFTDLTDDQYLEILDYFTLHHSPKKQKLTHLAINKPIPIEKQQDNTDDEYNAMRSPSKLTILYGSFDQLWCSTTQNGIYQTWMPFYTMFSRGNIKEKARILNALNSTEDRLVPYAAGMQDKTIVDLYAGIGYFTLSYLSRGAKRVICWEINQKSVDGLVKGVQVNKFGACYVIQHHEPFFWDKANDPNVRCIVFVESNEYAVQRMQELERQVGYNRVKNEFGITHFNLGLLPSSKPVWKLTCNLLNTYGDTSVSNWIHVHDNIASKELKTWGKVLESELGTYMTRSCHSRWTEPIKTYAPEVWHVVGDIEVDPAI